MPRKTTPVTAHLLRQLLAAARIDDVSFIHVAAVVEHNRSALMLHCGDGDAFTPATWQVPTGLAWTRATNSPTSSTKSSPTPPGGRLNHAQSLTDHIGRRLIHDRVNHARPIQSHPH